MSLPPLSQIRDYTRWNRAGRPRFDYVDGDPAVWLEEIRIALLTRYMRGTPLDQRQDALFRELFMRLESGNQDQADLLAAAARVKWAALAPSAPDRAENGAQRNERLRQQYNAPPGNYAWEIARAFARALHVQLGHLNAYANEGYLRTATQWDNVRKLAAMVNYQPSPPASATSHVALDLKADSPEVALAPGLAMKHTPPEGGAALIYESVEALSAHPGLNLLRPLGWNHNQTYLDFTGSNTWISESDEGMSPGQLAVLLRYRANGTIHTQARARVTAARFDKATGSAQITLSPGPAGQWRKDRTVLYLNPKTVLGVLPRSSPGRLVIKTERAGQYAQGTIVRITREDGRRFRAVVAHSADLYLTVLTPHRPEGSVQIERYLPFASSTSSFETPSSINQLFFKAKPDSGLLIVSAGVSASRQGTHIFTRPANGMGPGYALNSDPDAPRDSGSVIGPPEALSPDAPAHEETRVIISGKPPKNVKAGDWFISEVGDGRMKALQLLAFKEEKTQTLLQFDKRIHGLAPDTLLHGPFTQTLRPLEYDRDQRAAFSGLTLTLAPVPTPALALIKPGRSLIIDHEAGAGEDARLVSVKRLVKVGAHWTLEVTGVDDLTGWISGYTVIRANTLSISHGETKPAKVLGSGDGEQARQSFDFAIKDLSFIPSSVAEAGVAPDLTVRVGEEAWSYRDYTDPSAEGTPSYSITLNEDDTVRIHMRRRLPSARDNIRITRYRVGQGLKGNNCPSYSLTQPMKKHPHISAIHQPFQLAGGAEREDVASIRDQAPARLAANGRAVSLQDFARLAARHASVWQARAQQIPTPHGAGWVRLTIVPAGGGLVSDSLQTDLIDTLTPKALPGLRLSVIGFQAVKLALVVKVHGDWAVYDKGEVQKRALSSLVTRFTLAQRGLGQVFYISEVLSALEGVEGVTGATIERLAVKAGSPDPRRIADTDGKPSAVFPTLDQVAYIDSANDISVLTEVLR
ncbi:baseplate J/gp47 family protein [Woodsholea maritima]|nr:hypothetical protein [Woodsholea maritima]